MGHQSIAKLKKTWFFLQGILTSDKDRLAAAEGDVATSLIEVYKALGAGWELRLKDGVME